MGNKLNPGQLHGGAKLAASKFDADEIHVLQATWQDLADRSGGKGIDKDTFLQYFPLNGLLGDRLFAQFDKKANGFIDFDEFVTGLATVCRGSIDDKIHFLFNMYDVSHDKSVSKQELATLLNQIPKDTLLNSAGISADISPSSTSNENGSHEDPLALIADGEDLSAAAAAENLEFAEVDSYTNHDMVEKAFLECDLNHEGRLTYEEFKMWVQRNPSIMNYIESILPYNGPKDMRRHMDKSETLPHMKRVSSIVRMVSTRDGLPGLSRNLSVQEFAGEVFNHETGFRKRGTSSATLNGGRSRGVSIMSQNPSHSPLLTSTIHSVSYPEIPSTTPLVRDISSSTISSAQDPQGRKNSFVDSVSDSEEAARAHLLQAMELTQNEVLKAGIGALLDSVPGGQGISRADIDQEVYHTIVSMEDYLWKKGRAFSLLNKRYFLLSGNCMYYYTHKENVRPRGVIFLTGCIIERYSDVDMEIKGYYAFELLHQDMCAHGNNVASPHPVEHHRHEKRVLYCRSEAERDRWVVALQHAAHVVPIEEDYVIGRELGRGRFSVVCECVQKTTGEHYAVKIIDKNTIEKDEKELLRTEIAVLKLVNHPNIIRMEGLYESKQYIYIVMEMLKGGELFERIVGRPRFTEQEAARLLRPLLESVAYLHDLGIVHRDLKPENILCGEELEDLKIADFGLSKMILPKEKMDAACGTLSYVAPEVLTMQGYGKEADLWSVGVIMFLLLCGKLPFDGDDHNEIIRSTIQADLKVNPSVWNKLSEEAKSLLTSLLNKNAKDRITARDALKHAFMLANARDPLKRKPSSRALSSKSLHHQPVRDSPRGTGTGISTPVSSATHSLPNSRYPETSVVHPNDTDVANALRPSSTYSTEAFEPDKPQSDLYSSESEVQTQSPSVLHLMHPDVAHASGLAVGEVGEERGVLPSEKTSSEYYAYSATSSSNFPSPDASSTT